MTMLPLRYAAFLGTSKRFSPRRSSSTFKPSVGKLAGQLFSAAPFALAPLPGVTQTKCKHKRLDASRAEKPGAPPLATPPDDDDDVDRVPSANEAEDLESPAAPPAPKKKKKPSKGQSPCIALLIPGALACQENAEDREGQASRVELAVS